MFPRYCSLACCWHGGSFIHSSRGSWHSPVCWGTGLFPRCWKGNVSTVTEQIHQIFKLQWRWWLPRVWLDTTLPYQCMSHLCTGLPICCVCAAHDNRHWHKCSPFSVPYHSLIAYMKNNIASYIAYSPTVRQQYHYFDWHCVMIASGTYLIPTQE